MREYASGECASWKIDYTNENRIQVAIYGPGGGTRFNGMMTPDQARKLRDNLDRALAVIGGQVHTPYVTPEGMTDAEFVSSAMREAQQS